MRAVLWLSAVVAIVAIIACGRGSPAEGGGPDTSKPVPRPVRFDLRDEFVACPPDAPFIPARWLGSGHVADSLPQAAVAARRGLRVADVGFGSGRHALAIARTLGPEGRMVCRDINLAAVTALRHKAADLGLGMMDIAQSTEGDVNIPAASVDTLLLCDTYHLVHASQKETRDGFLRSIRGALVPGGELVICYLFAGVFNDPGDGREFLRESDELFARHGFERGRRWRFGREYATPLVLEFRRPLAD